jgi:hypothetical protein
MCWEVGGDPRPARRPRGGIAGGAAAEEDDVNPQTLTDIRAGVINVHSDTAYAIQELLDAYDAAIAELRLANDSCDAYAADVAELRAALRQVCDAEETGSRYDVDEALASARGLL